MQIDLYEPDSKTRLVRFETDPGSSFVEVKAVDGTSVAVAIVFLDHDEAQHLAGGCAAQHINTLVDAHTAYGTKGVVNYGDPGGTVTVHPDGRLIVDDEQGNVVELNLAGELGTASHAVAAGANGL